MKSNIAFQIIKHSTLRQELLGDARIFALLQRFWRIWHFYKLIDGTKLTLCDHSAVYILVLRCGLRHGDLDINEPWGDESKGSIPSMRK